jgi:hypothetical protein
MLYQREEPHSAGDGNRDGENLHRIPDNLALMESEKQKRILFLADRNILVDQTKRNDFKPFGSAMTKVTGRTVDPAYEVTGAVPGDHRAGRTSKSL